MKNYLCALICLCFTTICMSQETVYGIRGALNISNLDFDPDATFENKHRNGFAFGGFVEFGLTNDISLLTELQWSAEGGKAESLRADYIQLPILLRLAVSNDLVLGVGPQVALKTWENQDAFSTFAFSGVVGVEYMLNDELFLDTRYSYGISNVIDEDLSDDSAKNHVLQFGFGIKI